MSCKRCWHWLLMEGCLFFCNMHHFVMWHSCSVDLAVPSCCRVLGIINLYSACQGTQSVEWWFTVILHLLIEKKCNSLAKLLLKLSWMAICLLVVLFVAKLIIVHLQESCIFISRHAWAGGQVQKFIHERKHIYHNKETQSCRSADLFCS